METKATNLSKERKFEPISIEDIKEIAKLRDVNIASDENIKNSIKDKIEELEEQIDKNNSEMKSISIKYGINLLAILSGNPQLNMDKNNKDTKDGNKEKEKNENENEEDEENELLNQQIEELNKSLEEMRANKEKIKKKELIEDEADRKSVV